MKEAYNRIWARIGVFLSVTEPEMKILIQEDDEQKQKVLAKIFAEKRVVIEGDSYIPGAAIDHYNETYGTSYDCNERELNTESMTGKSVRLIVSSLRKDRGDAR